MIVIGAGMILCGHSGHGVNVARTSAAVVVMSSPGRAHVQRTETRLEDLMVSDLSRVRIKKQREKKQKGNDCECYKSKRFGISKV